MHGWINLNKPYNMTSACAVSQLKKILELSREVKVGHAGTLDPLASGVLPIAIGEATKTIQYVMNSKKSYYFTVQWGEGRTTDDAEGEITFISQIKPNVNDIQKVLENFKGEIIQTPPKFSALKINGIRAYKLARAGNTVELKPRLVNVYDIKLLSSNNEKNNATFLINCGSGVYVRSLARDMGISLQCGAYVSFLKRIKVGSFHYKTSTLLPQLKLLKESRKHLLLPIDFGLNNMSRLEISSEDAKKIKNGQIITLNSLCGVKNCGIHYVSAQNVPVAICKVNVNNITAIRVFNF